MNNDKPSSELVAAIVPTGTLRAAINMGNAVLAGRDGATGTPKGVAVDLASMLAERLGVPLELVVVDGAAKSVDAVANERADVGFFAIDPQRGADIAFTPPYVLIEGCYLVRHDSPIQDNDEVDRAGHLRSTRSKVRRWRRRRRYPPDAADPAIAIPVVEMATGARSEPELVNQRLL